MTEETRTAVDEAVRCASQDDDEALLSAVAELLTLDQDVVWETLQSRIASAAPNNGHVLDPDVSRQVRTHIGDGVPALAKAIPDANYIDLLTIAVLAAAENS